MPRHLLPALLAVLAAACASTRPPPASARAAGGTVVRAPDAAIARDVAALLDEIGPGVAGILPGTSARPFEIWVEDELSRPEGRSLAGVAAYTATFRKSDTGEQRSVIHLPVALLERRAVLAHELAHVRLGTETAALPDFLSEGICEYASCRVTPGWEARIGVRHRSLAAMAAGVVLLLDGAFPPRAFRPRLTRFWQPEDLLAVDLSRAGGSTGGEPEQVAYAFGWLFVEAIAARGGIGAVFDLSARAAGEGLARVPADRLLAAAGVAGDDSFAEWTRGRLDGASLRVLAEGLAPLLAVMLLGDLDDARRAGGPEALLAGSRPVLRAGDLQVDLRTVPAVADALREFWPRP